MAYGAMGAMAGAAMGAAGGCKHNPALCLVHADVRRMPCRCLLQQTDGVDSSPQQLPLPPSPLCTLCAVYKPHHGMHYGGMHYGHGYHGGYKHKGFKRPKFGFKRPKFGFKRPKFGGKFGKWK